MCTVLVPSPASTAGLGNASPGAWGRSGLVPQLCARVPVLLPWRLSPSPAGLETPEGDGWSSPPRHFQLSRTCRWVHRLQLWWVGFCPVRSHFFYWENSANSRCGGQNREALGCCRMGKGWTQSPGCTLSPSHAPSPSPGGDGALPPVPPGPHHVPSWLAGTQGHLCPYFTGGPSPVETPSPRPPVTDGITPSPLCLLTIHFCGTSRLCFWGSRSAMPNCTTQAGEPPTTGSPLPARQFPPPWSRVPHGCHALVSACRQVCPPEMNSAVPLPGSAL